MTNTGKSPDRTTPESPTGPDSTVVDESLFHPDGSMNMAEAQRCIDAVARRSRDAVGQLQQIVEIVRGNSQQFRIAVMSFQVGTEIGALLREIENFSTQVSVYGSDDRNSRIVAARVGVFLAPLRMAMQAFDLPQSDATGSQEGQAPQESGD